jgi:subtilase family serine protease
VDTGKNQGTSMAGPSVTKVDFFQYGSITIPTPIWGPGVSVDLNFPMPHGCHDPDCEFKITVDANNDVAESDEGNNVVNDTCIR